MLKLCRIIMGLPLLLTCSGAMAASPMNLRESLRYAVEHSPDLKIFKNQSEVAELGRKNAFWQMFPSVDLTATQGLQDSNPSQVQDPWTSVASLGVTANFYNNQRDYNNYQIAKMTAANQEVQSIRDRNQHVLNIVQAFYRFSNLVHNRSIQQQKFDILAQQFKTMDQAYRSGSRSRRDYLRFKAQVRRAEVGLITIRSDFQQAEQTLKRLLGLTNDEPAEFRAEEVVFSSIDPRQIPIVDVKQHYDYILASNQIGIETSNRKLKQRLYYPELFLDGGYNLGYSNYITNGPTDPTSVQNWSLLLALRYNVFDGGQRRREVEAASINLQTSELARERVVLETRRIVKALEIRARNLLADLRLNKELLDIETRSFQNIEREYRNGQASFLDFINSLNDFLDTKANFQTSYFNYLDVVASLKFHKGSIYEDFLGQP